MPRLACTQVHIVERIPWHEALWFVTTTLTTGMLRRAQLHPYLMPATVGFGDVVVRSTLGRMVVLALILVGVVLIPVQAGQLYSQLAARRVLLGADTFFVLSTQRVVAVPIAVLIIA